VRTSVPFSVKPKWRSRNGRSLAGFVVSLIAFPQPIGRERFVHHRGPAQARTEPSVLTPMIAANRL
jgi:hypothetical protein